MKVQGFSLQGFRGLWKFSAEFDAEKSFILFGRNATGKTSLYRGLQFALTGVLPEYHADSSESSYDLTRHVLLDSDDPAVVEAVLSDGSSAEEIRREIQSDGSLAVDYSSGRARRIAKDPDASLCFLTREWFTEMLDAAERDRWENLSPLLGHERLADYREGIRKIYLNLREDLGVSRYENRAQEFEEQVERYRKRSARHQDELELDNVTVNVLQKEILALLTPPEDRDVEVGEAEAEAYEELASADTVEDFSALSWEAVQGNLGGSEELSRMSERLSRLDSLGDILGFDVFEGGSKGADAEGPEGEEGSDDELHNLLILLAKLDDDPDVGHQILHAEFYARAQKVVAPYTDERCPVCGLEPDDWDAVRHSLEERGTKLQKVTREKRSVESEASRQLSTLKSVTEELDEFKEEHGLPDKVLEVHKEVQEGVDWLQLAVDRISDSPAKGLGDDERSSLKTSMSKVRKSRDEAREVVTTNKQELERTIEERDESPRRLRYANLEALADSWVDFITTKNKYERINHWLQAAEPILEAVTKYGNDVKDAEGRLSDEMLKSVEDRVQEIFDKITDNQRLTPVINRSEKRGVVRGKIAIEDFYGTGEKSAREYLSESYKNALGLSIFFAGMEYRAPELDALVMDDITHSTDDRHRRGLADFLWEDLSEKWQLLIFTHDKEWFERLRRLFKTSAQTRKVLKWNIKGIQTHSDTWKPLREEAREQVAADEVGAGVVLRMALEEFLDEVCEEYHVEIPFQRGAEGPRFEVKRNKLVKKLKDAAKNGNGIIDPTKAAVRNFETSQDLANLASHKKTQPTLSGGALKDALKDLEQFSQLFTCSNVINGNRCGGMLNTLRNTSSLPFECPKCNREFGR